jgi:SAM-dependent methyltransferase
MHYESYAEALRLVATYLDPAVPLRVLDVGSYDVNGSYHALFEQPAWRYEGADMKAGPNVDHVLEDPYHWTLPDESYDVVVSGQAFEHIQFFWLTWREMVRVLKPGGLIFLLAPSKGVEHRHPVDCWRFYRDGFRALAELEHLTVLECETNWDWPWGDTVGVFRKDVAP